MSQEREKVPWGWAASRAQHTCSVLSQLDSTFTHPLLTGALGDCPYSRSKPSQCLSLGKRPFSSCRVSIRVVMPQGSISLSSSYSGQTDLLAPVHVTRYTAITFSASNFSCTEAALHSCAQGSIAQMTLHANKICFHHANPNILLLQAQDVHSDHSTVPQLYLACYYTLRCSKHIFWLTRTCKEEAERRGFWKPTCSTRPLL